MYRMIVYILLNSKHYLSWTASIWCQNWQMSITCHMFSMFEMEHYFSITAFIRSNQKIVHWVKHNYYYTWLTLCSSCYASTIKSFSGFTYFRFLNVAVIRRSWCSVTLRNLTLSRKVFSYLPFATVTISSCGVRQFAVVTKRFFWSKTKKSYHWTPKLGLQKSKRTV